MSEHEIDIRDSYFDDYLSEGEDSPRDGDSYAGEDFGDDEFEDSEDEVERDRKTVRSEVHKRRDHRLSGAKGSDPPEKDALGSGPPQKDAPRSSPPERRLKSPSGDQEASGTVALPPSETNVSDPLNLDGDKSPKKRAPADLPSLPPKRQKIETLDDTRYPVSGEVKEWTDQFFVGRVLPKPLVHDMLSEVKLPDISALKVPVVDDILKAIESENNRLPGAKRINISTAQDGIYRELQKNILAAMAPAITNRLHAFNDGHYVYSDLAERNLVLNYHVFCTITFNRRLSVCRAFDVLNGETTKALCRQHFELPTEDDGPPPLFGPVLFGKIFKVAENISGVIKQMQARRRAHTGFSRDRGGYRPRGGYNGAKSSRFESRRRDDRSYGQEQRPSTSRGRGYGGSKPRSGNFASRGSARVGSVRIASERQASELRLLEAGSGSNSNRRLQCSLGPGLTLRISSVLPNRPVPEEAPAGQRNDGSHRSVLASAALVSQRPRHDLSISPSHSTPIRRPGESPGRRSSPLSRPGSDPDRMANFRSSLRLRGLSEKASALYLRSWKHKTTKQYKSALGRWHRWCVQQQVDSSQASPSSVANYLAECFEAGLSYSSINVARSAISSVSPEVEGSSIGAHPLVRRVMKGVFYQRPPASRYSAIWDPQIVLSHLRSLGPSQALSTDLLTKKLACLFSLCAASRAGELSKLDLSHALITETCARFMVILPKQSRPGKATSSLELHEFPQDQLICPLACLRAYLHRLNISAGPLFRSLVNSSAQVTSATIARWVKSIMSAAGIDISIFSAHSTRSAATSSAYQSLPLPKILEAANWSNSSTFFRHYCKPKHVTLTAAVLRKRGGDRGDYGGKS